MFSNKIIVLLSLFFILLILAVGYHSIKNTQNNLLESIDRELIAGANAVPLILGKDYHHKGLSTITKEQNLKNIRALQDYVKHTNLTYIYSFVQDDNGDIHFTSSSMTENEIEQDSAAIASFEVYEDADVKEVFETNKTLFVEGVDQWGHFRSVLIPVQAPDGSRYVIGADYKIKDINTLKANKKYQVLWVFIPLVLMTLIYFLLIMINIKHAQQIILEKTLELRKIYETDKLTKLPNREKLLHRLSKHSDSLLAIVDINNFKILNEIYGVEIADKFLIFIAKELEKMLSYKMELFKLDHDLFCIVSSNADLIYFKDYISKILEQLEKKEFIESNYSIHVTYTAGISHVKNMLNPMLAAEYALQNAKNKGEKVLCYIGSSEEFNSTTHKREVLDNINYAIKNNKIFPYFQPIYNTKTKTITKYEGLVRLETMDGKIMPPAYFLKTAIDTGLYKHISRIMLDKVVNTALKHPDFIFSINISALDIESEYIRSNILKTITKHKLQDRIILEVLESEEFKNFGALINFAQNANEQRIKLSLDDFGSGYSNFSNLVEIHFDYLKIDGSLIKHIVKDPRYEVIVKQIISFAAEMHSEVVAEFVEDETIAEKLTKLGVNYLQGYYIGKPLEISTEGLSI